MRELAKTDLYPDVDEVSLGGELAECDGGTEMEVRRPRSDSRHVAPRHRFEASLVRLPPRFFLVTLPVFKLNFGRDPLESICFIALNLNLPQLESIFSAFGLGYFIFQESMIV